MPLPPKSVSWASVCQVLLAYPGVEESTSYGTPALKVKGKLLVRFHQDGENIVVPMSKAERTRRMRQQPAVFHITDHYTAYPYVLVRMATVDVDDLTAVLETAWRQVAPKTVVKAYDAGEESIG